MALFNRVVDSEYPHISIGFLPTDDPAHEFPVTLIGSPKILRKAEQDWTFIQISSMAKAIPRITRIVMLPDMQPGYGFPIGCVFATELTGAIPPSAVGSDIGCGTLLVRTQLTLSELRPHQELLADVIFEEINSKSSTRHPIIFEPELLDLCHYGARATYFNQPKNLTLGTKQHLRPSYDNSHAAFSSLPAEAKIIATKSFGTLGGGNHFLEIGYVKKIFHPTLARQLGLAYDQICIQVHTGSRGFGGTIFEETLRKCFTYLADPAHPVPHKELDKQKFYLDSNYFHYELVRSRYASAMNFAEANRFQIAQTVLRSLCDLMGRTPEQIDPHVISDLTHNSWTIEDQLIDGTLVPSNVFRKGANRALLPGDLELNGTPYEELGYPTLIPGDMSNGCYVVLPTERTRTMSARSLMHGAGRLIARYQAHELAISTDQIKALLKSLQITSRTHRISSYLEECPMVYKNIENIIELMEEAGLLIKIAQIFPCVNLKE